MRKKDYKGRCEKRVLNKSAMKNYVLLWVVLTVLATVLLVLVLNGWSGFAVPGIVIVFIASVVTAIIIANEIRRPVPQEYYRKKALYPKIDDKFLFDSPPSGGVLFGKDIHTGKIVAYTDITYGESKEIYESLDVCLSEREGRKDRSSRITFYEIPRNNLEKYNAAVRQWHRTGIFTFGDKRIDTNALPWENSRW